MLFFVSPATTFCGRHVMLQHLRRIEPYYELAKLAADHADPVGAVDIMQARHEVVVHDVGQFGQAASLRTQAEIDDRKCTGRQQHRVDLSIVRATARGVCATSALSIWKPTWGSESSPKVTSISALPRVVVDRTSSTPGMLYALSSNGRVTDASIWSAGKSPLSARIVARRKTISGNTALGMFAPGLPRARSLPAPTAPPELSCCASLIVLRHVDAEAVGERIAARSHDHVALLDAVGYLNQIAIAQSYFDVFFVRATV